MMVMLVANSPNQMTLFIVIWIYAMIIYNLATQMKEKYSKAKCSITPLKKIDDSSWQVIKATGRLQRLNGKDWSVLTGRVLVEDASAKYATQGSGQVAMIRVGQQIQQMPSNDWQSPDGKTGATGQVASLSEQWAEASWGRWSSQLLAFTFPPPPT